MEGSYKDPLRPNVSALGLGASEQGLTLVVVKDMREALLQAAAADGRGIALVRLSGHEAHASRGWRRHHVFEKVTEEVSAGVITHSEPRRQA